MPIDTSIYGNLQTPDFAGNIERGLRMRDLMDQRKKQTAIRDAYQKGTSLGPDGKLVVDRGLTIKSLYEVSPEDAIQAEDRFAQQDAAKAKGTREQLEQTLGNMKRAHEIFAAAKDQESWDQASNIVSSLGLMKREQISPVYDEKQQSFLANLFRTGTERLQQEQAERGWTFKENEALRDQKNKDLDRGLKRDELDAKIQGGEKLKITGDQAKAAGFANRIRSAESVMEGLEKDGFTGSDTRSWVQKKLFQEAKPVNLQKLEQAQRNFINAVLRRESGAAISGSEFDSANLQYFPQRGDSPEVLEQKRQNRLDALASLEAEAGPGLEHVQRARERIARDNTFGRAPVMTPGNREINILPRANAAGQRQVFKTSDIEWAD